MDDIIVTGRRYRAPRAVYWGIDPAPQSPNPEINPNGPEPEEPDAEHTNRSDLFDPRVAVAGLEDTSNFYLPLGGRLILVIISNTLSPQYHFSRQYVSLALGRLVSAYANGPQSLKTRIDNIDRLVIADVYEIRQGPNVYPGRSASLEDTKTFYYDFNELIAATPEFIASNIFHDAGHMELFWNNQVSRGVPVEYQLINDQINTASLFGLSQAEVSALIAERDNPAALAARANTGP